MTVWSIAQPKKIEEDAEKELLNRWTNALDNVQKSSQEKFKLFKKLWWIDKAFLAIIIGIAVICRYTQLLSPENIMISINWAVIPVTAHLLISTLIVFSKSWNSDKIRDVSKNSLKIDGKLSNENFNMVKKRMKDIDKLYLSTIIKAWLNAMISVTLMCLPLHELRPYLIDKRELGVLEVMTLRAGLASSIFAFLSTIGNMFLWSLIDAKTFGKIKELIDLEDKEQAESHTLISRWTIALDNVQKNQEKFKLFGILWWIDKVFFAVVTGIVVICLINRSLITPNMMILMNSVFILEISFQLFLSCLWIVKTWTSENIPKNLDSLQGNLSNENVTWIKRRLEVLGKSYASTLLKILSNTILSMITMCAFIRLNREIFVIMEREEGSLEFETFRAGLYLTVLAMIVNFVPFFFSITSTERIGKMQRLLEDDEQQITLEQEENEDDLTAKDLFVI